MKFNIEIAIRDKGVCGNQQCHCDECEVGEVTGAPAVDQLCPHELVFRLAKLLRNVRAEKWVKVEEQLPWKNENVLCTAKGEMYISTLVHSETSYLNYADQCSHEYIKKNTTHWMPLPKAPVKKEV